MNTFDGTTGYANAMLVFEDDDASKKVVAIIVNTNVKSDVLGGTNVSGAFTITVADSDTPAAYTVTADKTTGLVVGDTVKLTFKNVVALSGAGMTINVTHTGADGDDSVTFDDGTAADIEKTVEYEITSSTVNFSFTKAP